MMEEKEIDTLSFDYLYDLSMEELVQIAMEKEIPNMEELDQEELISAIELAVLSGLEEANEAEIE
jgi:hypothetical protein